MSNSNINDIFVLSSYTSSARGKAAAKYTPGVYASSSKSAKSSDGFVTVAVQADGVHVLDVRKAFLLNSSLLSLSRCLRSIQ